jgi:hypothetical protein
MLGPVGRWDVWIGWGIEGGRRVHRIKVKGIRKRNDSLGQARDERRTAVAEGLDGGSLGKKKGGRDHSATEFIAVNRIIGSCHHFLIST